MATRTTISSGLWSNAAIWNTGVPVDGDSFIVSGGHTVLFDVNQSAMVSGMASGTIWGTFEVASGLGTVYLKMSGNSGADLGGFGTWRIGSPTSPYPVGSNFIIDLQSLSRLFFNTGMVLPWYGSSPRLRFVNLVASAAIGATALLVDNDISQDVSVGGWIGAVASGTPLPVTNLRICDVNQGNDNEANTLVSATSSMIVLASGLGAQKEVGAYVFLTWRNILIRKTALATTTLWAGSHAAGNPILHSVAQIVTSGGNNCTHFSAITSRIRLQGSTVISGGGTVFSIQGPHSIAGSSIITGAGGTIFSGVARSVIAEDAIISGCNTTFSGSNAGTIKDRVIITGCTNGVGGNVTICGSVGIFACSVGLINNGIYTLNGVTIGGSALNLRNGADVSGARVIGYGSRLASPRPNTSIANVGIIGKPGSGFGFATLPITMWDVADASGIAQPGRIFFVTSGGSATTIESGWPANPPTTPEYCHLLSYEASGNHYPLWVDFPIFAFSNSKLTINAYLSNTVTGSWGQLPRIQICSPNNIIEDEGGIISQVTTSDITAWQSYKLEYTSTVARNLVLRIIGYRSFGQSYFYFNMFSGQGYGQGVRIGANI